MEHKKVKTMERYGMETKDMTCKGTLLKRKACVLCSFTDKEKDIMKDICEKLALSNLIYEDAKEIYVQYLKMVVNGIGVYSTKNPVIACVYLSALKNEDPRYKREVRIASGTSEVTISKWVQEINYVLKLKLHLTWEKYNKHNTKE